MTFLTDDEIRHLTKKTRWSAQVRALAAMGIPFERRPDGSPVVRRSAIEPANDRKPGNEPNWNAA